MDKEALVSHPTSAGVKQHRNVPLSSVVEAVNEVPEVGDTATSQDVKESDVDGVTLVT